MGFDGSKLVLGSSVMAMRLRPAGDDVGRLHIVASSGRSASTGLSSEASFEKTLTLSSGLNWKATTGTLDEHAIGVPRERRVGARVELAVGAAVDLARAELEHLEIERGDGRRRRRRSGSGGRRACRRPGRSARRPATSGCALETTIAYCCAAAFSVVLMTALSRSTPQYSQPTLLRSPAATPAEVHADAVAAGLAGLGIAGRRRPSAWLPSALHEITSSPWHEVRVGQTRRAFRGATARRPSPLAAQSSSTFHAAPRAAAVLASLEADPAAHLSDLAGGRAGTLAGLRRSPPRPRVEARRDERGERQHQRRAPAQRASVGRSRPTGGRSDAVHRSEMGVEVVERVRRHVGGPQIAIASARLSRIARSAALAAARATAGGAKRERRHAEESARRSLREGAGAGHSLYRRRNGPR